MDKSTRTPTRRGGLGRTGVMECGYERWSAFDRERDAVAAAEAERGNPSLEIAPLQRVQQRRQHTRATRPDRVPERDSPAIDVHSCGVDAEFAEYRDHLHRECFVDLEEIDVLEIPSGLDGDFSHRFDRGH